MFACLDTSIVSTALVSVSAQYHNYQDTPWLVLGYLLTYMSEWSQQASQQGRDAVLHHLPEDACSALFFHSMDRGGMKRHRRHH